MYFILFISIIVIIYKSINTAYKQIKKADIFLTDSGNNFDTENEESQYEQFDNFSNHEYNNYYTHIKNYDNPYLYYLMGLDKI